MPAAKRTQLPGERPISSTLRVGVIGVGYLGRIHARIYSKFPGVRLVGVADTNPKVAEQVAAECACEAHTDPNGLLDKVDAVSIVVPTVSHGEVARPYLESGVHMLMEKPIAPTIDESLALVELAERSGVIFQVGHLERFNAGVMLLAEKCQNPQFIEVHRLGTFVRRATDVDVVTDLMIHDIDIVLSLVRSKIKHIAAVGVPVLTRHADIGNARIEFENGAVANVTASRVSLKKLRRIRVFGNKRYFALNYIDQQLEILRAETDGDAGELPQVVAESLTITPRPPLDAELEHFIASVRSGTPPLVDGRVGLEALRVALLVKESMSACPLQ